MAPKPVHVLGKSARGKHGGKPAGKTRAPPAPAAREATPAAALDPASKVHPKDRDPGPAEAPAPPPDSPHLQAAWLESVRREFLAEKPG